MKSLNSASAALSMATSLTGTDPAERPASCIELRTIFRSHYNGGKACYAELSTASHTRAAKAAVRPASPTAARNQLFQRRAVRLQRTPMLLGQTSDSLACQPDPALRLLSA